jgi:hypothetical protein
VSIYCFPIFEKWLCSRVEAVAVVAEDVESGSG